MTLLDNNPAIRVLRAGERPATPWKNGGGVTYEVAAFPEGASFDTFDWRVSIAHVARNSQFSTFWNVDRTLVLLQGDGAKLSIGERSFALVTPSSPYLSFSGDAATTARLVGGPIVNLNVMTRRDRFTHQAERVPVARTEHRTFNGDIALVVALTNDLTLRVEGEEATLAHYDAAIFDRHTYKGAAFHAAPGAEFIVVSLSRAASADAGVTLQ